MIYAAILAGGKGTRVGAKVPKQFLELGGKPILIRTIDTFVESKLVDFIYISVNEMWLEHTRALLEQYYDEDTLKNFKLVCGGQERMMSFLNVIYDIRDTFGVHETDMILSHDAVRPFVTKEILLDCIEKTREYKVAMASVASADTTYAALKEGFLTSTYDRKTLYLGQTPQGCMMDLMDEVIRSYTEEELLTMTGTSQLFINRGIDVKISLGSVNNLKITTLKDIDFIEYMYGKEKADEQRTLNEA
jgi:2-C-methyl-D-erythritol 4-phosphate cytidylyltransferase